MEQPCGFQVALQVLQNLLRRHTAFRGVCQHQKGERIHVKRFGNLLADVKGN